MMRKKLVLSIILLGMVLAGVAMFVRFRESFPYTFEVVRLEGGRLGIVNREVWNTRDLEARLVSGGEAVAKGVIDGATNSGILMAPAGLERGEIVVRRTDMLGRLKYTPATLSIPPGNQPERFIMLVGASIGQGWNLPGFGTRAGMTGYACGFRGKYDFDKSDVLAAIRRYRIKPDAVIIKECAAYFPRDLESGRKLLEQWVGELEAGSILPVIATTPPVVDSEEHRERQRSVEAWNRYVREFAAGRKIPVLDLAGVLQVSGKDPHLKAEFAAKDGLHLNERAYREALDPILKEFLLRAIGPRSKPNAT